MSERPLTTVIGPSFAAACGYETAALTTGLVPPLSHYLWRLPTWARAAVFVVGGLVAFDHLFTRRLT